MKTKEKNKIITAVNYIKVLLEDDKLGESLKYINILQDSIENQIDISINIDLLQLNKQQLKIKPGNFIFIHDTWFKLIKFNKKENLVLLEPKPGKIINKKYDILNESTTKNS